MKKIETSEVQDGWARFDATTDEEAHAIALADPDNPPITDEAIASSKLRRVPGSKSSAERFA
jgi:hypothetical protein